MSRLTAWLTACVLLIVCTVPILAQQTTSTGNAAVPPLVSFSGVLTDLNGKPLTTVVGVTFAIYQEQQGGAPLWLETQNIYPDPAGHYSVTLGSTSSSGIPAQIFVAGEAHWLGVQPQGQPEQPRVMLLSVPYALVAGNAQTIGGLPASAFVLAAPPTGGTGQNATPGGTPATPSVGGSGTLDYIPLWIDSSGDLGNSVMFQSGTGSTAKIGINTITPATTLDVKGSATVRGVLETPAIANATATKGSNSNPMALVASGFNSSTGKPVTQNFVWQAEPVGNDTTTPSGTLNLLFGAGTATPAETGLHIASNGQINFATGQTFPGTGTGNGTVTSVASGLGLTGGPITTTGTLTIDTTVVPQLNVANVFTGNQTVNGNLSATGLVTGTAFNIGSNLFAWGSYANANALLGFAGNSTMTGTFNTASGENALFSNTSGGINTAEGSNALYANTTGTANTAVGQAALASNTTGFGNTATGAGALGEGTTGNYNTAGGVAALYSNTTGSYNSGNGTDALYSNSTGYLDTASGYQTLYGNTTGPANTAIGSYALQYNTTGSFNTALGYNAGTDQKFPSLSNATAIGANADVTQSNSLVLGSISGVNGAGASTSVGIGTTAPAYTLDVQGSGRFTQPIVFAANQQFPGVGTITGVTAGVGLSGGGTSGNVTLTNNGMLGFIPGTGIASTGGQIPTVGIDTTVVPQLNAPNTFTGNQTVNGTLTATSFSGNGSGLTGVTSMTTPASMNAALLRWYPQTYPVGTNPHGVAFDGSNIWVANYGDNTVTKLLASSGALVGTYSVGTGPWWLAFDGANIWVANYGSNNVTELSASTGAVVGTYTVGTQPWGVAFDGTNIWVTNYGSGNVTELSASTGAVVGTYAVGSHPTGVAFDGTNIWVAVLGSNSVTKLLASNGSIVGTYQVGSYLYGVAFDGINIWVAFEQGVAKLLASSGAVVGSYPLGFEAYGVAFDGNNIWVTSNGAMVDKLLAGNGALMGTYSFVAGVEAEGVAFDGSSIWFANETSGNVIRIPAY